MNPYLETLKDELREECGDTICQADWDCFWGGLRSVDNVCEDAAKNAIDPHGNIEFLAVGISVFAQGTRADLPSIVKYAYAAIEENLK